MRACNRSADSPLFSKKVDVGPRSFAKVGMVMVDAAVA